MVDLKETFLTQAKQAAEKQHLFKKQVVNRLFGKLQKVEWISQIKLSEAQEAEIESCFEASVEFHYSK